MNTDERTAFKKSVIAEIIKQKSGQLEELKAEQKRRLASANEEDIDKSNPVESPKEQMMEEIDLQAASTTQLAEEIVQLERINPDEKHHTVAFGAMVRTNTGYFLIGAAFPPSQIAGKKVTGLSTQAPLFQKMAGFREQAEFHWRDIEYVILEIT